jgi:hypothetical protein
MAMHKTIVVAYVVAAAVLLAAQSLLLSCGIESKVVHRISEMTSFIGPLVVSWRLATRMKKGFAICCCT